MANEKRLDHDILAEGEATGHAHRAVGPGVALYEGPAGAMRLAAPSGCEVVHEEHATIALPPGDYDRTIVREYDHFAEESRQIAD